MTNRDKINAMSNQELALWMCYGKDCMRCAGLEMCKGESEPGAGLRKWLEAEAEEDNG